MSLFPASCESTLKEIGGADYEFLVDDELLFLASDKDLYLLNTESFEQQRAGEGILNKSVFLAVRN